MSNRGAHVLTVGLMGLCLALPGPLAQTLTPEPLLPTGPMSGMFAVNDEGDREVLTPLGPLHGSDTLMAAYSAHQFGYFWRTAHGLSPQGLALFEIIADCESMGLDPQRYHLDILAPLVAQEQTFGPQAPNPVPSGMEPVLDLYLSDAFLMYAKDIRFGRLKHSQLPVPEESEENLEVWDPKALLPLVMDSPLEEVLAPLQSSHPQIAKLSQVLAFYRAIAEEGGWPEVPGGDKIEPGMSSPRIPLLRQRLQAEGYLSPSADLASDLYDQEVEAAVKEFQRRNGLWQDGVIGKRTVRDMNVTAEERVRQIALNLERLRAHPRDAQGRYVLVNIPAFTLEYVEEDQLELEMKVVVGRRSRQTPVFRGEMRYLVLAPKWRVPHRLAKLDVLRDAQKDDQYLVQKGFHVYTDWSESAVEVDPCAVDWSQIKKKELTYRFIQDPGPYNSLGHIKFMFPNRHSVYLHDTPSRYLFRRAERAVSSGCIRLEKPLELAVYLMQDGTPWNQEALEFGMTMKKPHSVNLPAKVPVFLVYWTAWVDAEGTVQFRNDLYGLDRKALQALDKLTER